MTNLADFGRRIFPDEPVRFNSAEFSRLLVCAVEAGASDVTIRSNCRVFAHIAGRIVAITERRLEKSEVELLIRDIYGENAMTMIGSGEPIDPSHEIRVGKNRYIRFRVNATGARLHGDEGLEITIRTIPSDPPSFADLGIEAAIVDNFVHPQGLTLISGPTGSGKTTLLAAGIRSVLENPDSHKKIITYEAPIEFTFDRFDDVAQSSFITQSELPRHIGQGFHGATRNAMRRASSIILYGECRDRETMSSAMEGANTGHMIYATLHSLGVGKTMMRIAQLFQGDPQEQLQMMLLAADCLRMIVSQTLLKRVDDPTKRVAIREFLVFTPEVREELLWLDDPMKIVMAVRRRVVAEGNSIEQQAERLFAEGKISRWDFLKLRQGGQVSREEPATATDNNPTARAAGHELAESREEGARHVA